MAERSGFISLKALGTMYRALSPAVAPQVRRVVFLSPPIPT